MTKGSDTRSMTDVLLADEGVLHNDGLTRIFRSAMHMREDRLRGMLGRAVRMLRLKCDTD
jgi:hypothetical protein